MRRSNKAVHTVRLVLGLVAVSLSVLGAVRSTQDVPTTAAQTEAAVTRHG